MCYINKIDDDYYLNDKDKEPQKCEVKLGGFKSETVVLPLNSTGRTLINKAKLDIALENADRYELGMKAARVLGPRTGTSTPKKPLTEYMTDEEREQYEAIIKAATERRAEATKKKPLTAIEKAERQAAAAKARYEALLAAAQAESAAVQDNDEEAEPDEFDFSPDDIQVTKSKGKRGSK